MTLLYSKKMLGLGLICVSFNTNKEIKKCIFKNKLIQKQKYIQIW